MLLSGVPVGQFEALLRFAFFVLGIYWLICLLLSYMSDFVEYQAWCALFLASIESTQAFLAGSGIFLCALYIPQQYLILNSSSVSTGAYLRSSPASLVSLLFKVFSKYVVRNFFLAANPPIDSRFLQSNFLSLILVLVDHLNILVGTCKGLTRDSRISSTKLLN